jgi:hypothetical protein
MSDTDTNSVHFTLRLEAALRTAARFPRHALSYLTHRYGLGSGELQAWLDAHNEGKRELTETRIEAVKIQLGAVVTASRRVPILRQDAPAPVDTPRRPRIPARVPAPAPKQPQVAPPCAVGAPTPPAPQPLLAPCCQNNDRQTPHYIPIDRECPPPGTTCIVIGG